MIKILYIAGWGRSGSTLLGNVLNEVESVFHAGEVRYLWEHGLLQNDLCGCGAPIRQCPLWSSIIRSLDPGKDWRAVADLRDRATMPRRTLRGRLGGTKAHLSTVREYARVLERVYTLTAETAGARVIVDSSKNPGELRSFAYMDGIEPFIVHLVRDPRGCAHSWSKHLKRSDHLRGPAEMETRGAASGTVKWCGWNAATELNSAGQRYRRITYEAFAEAPQVVVRDLMTWLGLEGACPVDSDGRVTMRGNHTVWGNPGRMVHGPVEIRKDDAWRTKQSAMDRALVSAIAAPCNLRYGYPLWR